MNPYTCRFLGFLCISMALALALGPYPGTRSALQTVDAVYLSAVGLTSHAFGPACPEKPFLIESHDLEPFPKIKEALESPLLSTLNRTRVSIHGGRLSQFTHRLTGQERMNFCFKYKGKTYFLERTLIHDLGMINLVGLETRPPGTVNITRNDLNLFPTLKSYLDSLCLAVNGAANIDENAGFDSPESGRETAFHLSSREMVKTLKQAREEFDKMGRQARAQINRLKANEWISLFGEKRRDFNPHEWALLCRKIACGGGHFRFICEDYVISGRQETITDRVVRPVKGFKIIRYILAAVFLFPGLFAMGGLYGRRGGIRLNPIWSAALGDCIIVLFIGFGAYCLVDYILVRLFEMRSSAPDPIVRGLCAIAYLPATGFFSIFSANLGDQGLEIEKDGVLIYYPGSERFLPWETITGFDLRETCVVAGPMGILTSRKLQTKLIIMTDEGEISLVEPGLRGTKSKIIKKLRTDAPEHLQSDAERLNSEW